MSSKKQRIKHLYNVTLGGHPRPARNQAEALKKFEIELYTRKERLVFELIQNADDFPDEKLGVVDLKFTFLNENILVTHNGREFIDTDVESISSIGDSAKAQDVLATGYKGIGFKSVFTHSKKVFISSGGYLFRYDKSYEKYLDFKELYPSIEVQNEFKGNFDEHANPNRIPWELMPIWTEKNEFPNEVKDIPSFFESPVGFVLSFGKENVEEFKPKIEKLFQEPRFLLFLRNINSIKIEGLKKNINVIRERDNSFCNLKINNKSSETFLMLKNPIKVSISAEDRKQFEKLDDIPPKLKKLPSFGLNFAIGFNKNKLIPIEDSVIFTYLPTEDKTYEFPFLVNSDFITSSNREVILPDNKWNKFVFEHIGYELFNWIKSIVETDNDYKFSFTSIIPSKFELEDDDTDSIKYYFNKGFDRAIEEIAFLPTYDGNFCKPSQAIIDLTGVSEIIGCDFFLSIIDSDRKLVNSKVKNISRILFDDTHVFILNNLKELFTENRFKEILNPKLLLRILKLFSKNKYYKNKFENIPILIGENNIKNLVLASNTYFQTDKDDKTLLIGFGNINFLHPVINDFAEKNIDFKGWLMDRGVKEFKGETFIRDEIIDKQNSINQSLNNHFNNKNFWNFIFRYHKNLSEIELKKLNNFYLIDESKNKLGIASSFYLSDYFSKKGEPSIEDVFEELDLEGLFVCKGYYQDTQPASWRNFFSKIGVKKSESATIFKDKVVAFIKNGKITENNYLKITKFIFEVFHSNKSVFAGVDLSKFEVLTRENKLVKISDCILGNSYIRSSKVDSTLKEYELENQISRIYLKEISNDKQKWREFFLYLNPNVELNSLDIVKTKIELISENPEKVTKDNVMDIWKTIIEYKDELLETHSAELEYIPVLLENGELECICNDHIYFSKTFNPKTDLEKLFDNYNVNFLNSKYASLSNSSLKSFFREIGIEETIAGFETLSISKTYLEKLNQYQFCVNFWNYFKDNFDLIDLSKSQKFLNSDIPLPCLDETVKYSKDIYAFSLKSLLRDNSITCSIKFNDKIEDILNIQKILSLPKCFEILNRISNSKPNHNNIWLIYEHIINNFINKNISTNTKYFNDFKQNGKLLSNFESFESIDNLYFQDSSTYYLPLENNKKIVKRISNRENWQKFEIALLKLGVEKITESDFSIEKNNSKIIAKELREILETSVSRIASRIEITNQKSLENKLNTRLKKLEIYYVNKLFLNCEKLEYNVEIPNYYDKPNNTIYYSGRWDSISNAKIIDYLFESLDISEKQISKDEFISILLSQNLVEEPQEEGIQETYERSSNYQSGRYVNKTVARYGEEFVNKELNKYFRNRVTWLNEKGEAGNPYDFIIYTDETKSEMLFYVDAKSTLTGEKSSDSIPFFIMNSEWDLIKRGNSKYVVARVFNANSSPIVRYVNLHIEKF